MRIDLVGFDHITPKILSSNYRAFRITPCQKYFILELRKEYMESLVDFALQERYKQVKDLGDRLGELANLIEWGPFREIVGEIYANTTEQGGRPNIDVILMIKLLVLQSKIGRAHV